MTEVGWTLAAVFAVASVGLGCSSGGETDADESPTTADESPTTAGDVVQAESAGVVDLTALRPVDVRSVALASPAEAIVVADGQFADDGDDPHLRVWVAPSTDPGQAEAFDLERLGSRSRVQAIPWNDAVAMVGLRCPEPFVPPEPDTTIEAHTNVELCGSTVWDAWIFEPSTGATRVVLEDVDLGQEGTLSLRAATDERLLLSEGSAGPDAMVSIATDGSVDRLDGPTATVEPGASVGATVCAVGGVVFSLTRSDVEREAPGQTIVRPLNDYFVLRRLDGDRWVEEALRDSGYDAAFAEITGCTDEGIVVASSPDTLDVSPPNPPLVLHPSEPPALALTAISTEGLPTPAALQFEAVIDGALGVQMPAEPPRADFYLYRAGSWSRWAEIDADLKTADGVAVGADGILVLRRDPSGEGAVLTYHPR